MLPPLLILSQLLISILCNSTTTEEYIWDRDEMEETAAVNQSTPSVKISDIILEGYVRSLTPCDNGPVEVFFDVSGFHLAKVQSNQRTVTASLMYVMRWNDYRLRWNPADHSNVTEINLPDYVVWLPPFVFYNSVKFKFLQNENARLARISNNGDVYYVAQTSLISSCWMGTAYFPFDVQDCFLTATTPLLSSDEVVAMEGRTFDFYACFVMSFLQINDSFQGNDEFEIRNVTLSTGNYSEFGVPKSEIYITIRMARHSLSYVIVLIVPTAFLSFIATAGFFGTNNTDCITNIGFSSLLTISMLLQILSGIVPKSSELPLLGYYITATLVIMCAAAFLSIAIAIIEKRVDAGEIEDGPPGWLVRICCGNVKPEEDDSVELVELSSLRALADSDDLARWVKMFLNSAYSTIGRIREEIENEKITESWSVIFRRIRVALLVIFELVHLSILIVLLSYWGKENIAPVKLDADGIPL